jgi:hypothetical protein
VTLFEVALPESSFAGFQDRYPDFDSLDLESLSIGHGSLLSPLSRLRTLSMHSCRNTAAASLSGLGDLEYLQASIL